MYYIYRHILPDGLSYIGKTSDIKKRYQNGQGYKQCTKFNNAIIKFGWNNIKHEILFETQDEIEARKLEKEMIQKYNSIKNGYNSNNKQHQHKSQRINPLQQFNQYNLNGEFLKTFKNTKELWGNGFVPEYVRACCNGRIKTSQGYIWKFA